MSIAPASQAYSQIIPEAQEELGCRAGPALSSREVPFKDDTYAHLMWSMIELWDNGIESLHGVIHAGVLWALTLLVHGMLIGFLLLNVEDMESSVENSYFEKHYNVSLAGASARLVGAASANKTLDLSLACGSRGEPGESFLCRCQEQLHVQWPSLYYVMIGIWMVFMVIEMRTAIWWLLHLLGVSTEGGAEILRPSMKEVKDTDGEDFRVNRITRTLRFFLVLVDPTPRFGVAWLLLFVGSKFLILQTDQTKLVMKVLCMKWVVKIDEILYHGLVTDAKKAVIGQARLKTAWGRPHRHSLWERGLGFVVQMTVCIVFLVAIVRYLFYDLVHFRESCRIYRDAVHPDDLIERTSIWQALSDIWH